MKKKEGMRGICVDRPSVVKSHQGECMFYDYVGKLKTKANRRNEIPIAWQCTIRSVFRPTIRKDLSRKQNNLRLKTVTTAPESSEELGFHIFPI